MKHLYILALGPLDNYLSILSFYSIYIDHSYFIHLSLSKKILYSIGQAEFVIAPARQGKVVRVYFTLTFIIYGYTQRLALVHDSSHSLVTPFILYLFCCPKLVLVRLVYKCLDWPLRSIQVGDHLFPTLEVPSRSTGYRERFILFYGIVFFTLFLSKSHKKIAVEIVFSLKFLRLLFPQRNNKE